MCSILSCLHRENRADLTKATFSFMRMAACLNEVNLAPGAMSARDIVGLCRALADAGIEQVIVNMPDAHELRPLETFGREIIPEVAAF